MRHEVMLKSKGVIFFLNLQSQKEEIVFNLATKHPLEFSESW